MDVGLHGIREKEGKRKRGQSWLGTKIEIGKG